MGKIQLQTAQNIIIDQNLAGIRQRILAVILDMLFLGLFYYLLLLILSKTAFFNKFSVWSFMSVLMLPYFLYYPLFQYWNNGQSFGKQIMRIRIVKTDNSHPRLGDFLIRWVLRLFEVNMIPGLALIVMLFSDKKQRLGDLAANTVVVKDQILASLDRSIFEELSQDYQPVFPSVKQFNDRDIQKIKTILQEARVKENKKILKALVHKIEKILQIEKPKDWSYSKFIDQIIKDYNYYARHF